MILENRRFVLRSRPELLADSENFELQLVPVPKPRTGEALIAVEMAALSAWQGMRCKDFHNFIRPFEIGQLIDCDVYGRVVESAADNLPVGTCVVGRLGWQDFAITTPDKINVVSSDFSAEEWLTALSSPGQTPYLAFSQKARPMPGETLVVTSAAGAVGSYAVQLGRLAGMRVIGISGGAGKCNFVRDTLGADACVDYKTDSFEDDLAAACPDGIDLYFDIVGGRTADAVFRKLAKNAQVLLVGRVAANNSPNPEWDPANMRQVWSQEATIHAFSRYSYKSLYPLVNARLGRLLREGKLQMNNVLKEGFETTPVELNRMLSGQHLGKVLVRYADREGNRL